ncbi:AraC family transcriptional regulator [Paenibacillus senegalensis]|uniref:AraC family transcriptional regulator n=1 Tax=Paenibacillus senegalensis TaxID=1465766 RepID=UPI00028895F7|nr:AraC family transcriptional regulator [Paenibacillus senegalensis]
MKDTVLLHCGFSCHSEPYHSSYRNGVDSYLFRLQTEGSSTAYYYDEKQHLQAGDLLLLKPGDIYTLEVTAAEGNPRLSSSDYYLFCEGEWIDSWWRRSKRPAVSRIDFDDKLLGLWRSLILEKRRGPDEQNVELAAYMLRSLCLYLDRSVTETQLMDRTAFIALRLKRYIEEHATASAPLRIEEAARHAGLSVSRAVHLFKQCYNQTMVQYANEVRLNTALERMKYSNMKLEQVAETSGFASYSYFHRVFRSRFGVSPAKYRSSERL